MPSRIFGIALCTLLPVAGLAAVSNLSFDGKTVTYEIGEPDFVTVEVLSTNGEHRATAFAGSQVAGPQAVAWKGADDQGHPLPVGDYVLRVRAGRTAVLDEKFGGQGFVQFLNPTSLSMDDKGALYVAELNSKGRDVLSGAGLLHKLKSDGTSCADFLRWWGAKPTEPKVDSMDLPRFTVWVEIGDDHTILYNDKNTVALKEYGGKLIRHIGGVELQLDAQANCTRRTGSAWPLYGTGLGEGNKIYIRDTHAIRAYDRSKAGFDGYLYSSAEDLPAPPVVGIGLGPCVVADKIGRIYTTSVRGLSRLTDTGREIRFDYDALAGCRECIGLAIGHDSLIYVADRGISAEGAGPVPKVHAQPKTSVWLFWDNGAKLVPVWQMDAPSMAGLRDVAVSPDGKSLYLLEDGDNFANVAKDIVWGDRFLEGKARLLKYDITFKQEVQKTIRVP